MSEPKDDPLEADGPQTGERACITGDDVLEQLASDIALLRKLLDDGLSGAEALAAFRAQRAARSGTRAA